jgi:AraC-like DNA-binding protein
MKADKQSCRSLSKFHFHRLFESAVGVSPSRYHMNLWMDEAKRLLRENKEECSVRRP